MKKFYIVILIFTLCSAFSASAQHTLAVTGGVGMGSARFYPKQETKGIWGLYQGGVSWRYYSETPRFVGGFGIDLEWLQRGFSYAPYASYYEDKKDFKYYTRHVNTVMLPIVWQPHFYIKKRIRVYLEAAFTLSYNFCQTFENEEPRSFGSVNSHLEEGQDPITKISGKYDMRTERDNHFGYGLAGGGGVDVLIKQIEIGVRVRYNFGYSDLMKNRNKYYDNGLDQKNKPGENPFWYTPLRSPLDNLTISVKIGWRFNKSGFNEWTHKRIKRPKQTIKFGLD